MTDIVAAFAAIKARAVAELTTQTLRWPDDDSPLPENPAPFVFFELITDPGTYIELGGGRGANRWRNSGEIHAYAFVPRGQGAPVALTLAETVAAAFRSYRGSGITCRGATVYPIGEGATLVPPGLSSLAGNYSCAVVAVPIVFDQTA